MSAVEDINKLVTRGQQYEEQAEGQEGYTAIHMYRLAASSYGDAARLAEGLVGPYDASTLTYRDLWAVSLKDAGDIEAAILCEVENIKRHKKTYGLQHDATLDAMRRLALNYLRSKRYGEALELYESVVDVLINKKAEIGVVCQSRTDWATALFESGTTRNGETHAPVYEPTKTLADHSSHAGRQCECGKFNDG
jgi:tetratricopeptide (TPR) repeat protein